MFIRIVLVSILIAVTAIGSIMAIQMKQAAADRLRSAEESGCQRFVELRNGGNHESDTESKV